MTDTPMTPDRERMIRFWHEELARLTDRTDIARREALGDLLAEVDRLRARVDELETFAHGCDGEGCVFPHSSWCERAKQQAAENGGCTCPRVWPDSPHPHASYCWLVSPPRNEVDELRAQVAELGAQRAAVLALHRKHDDSDHCFADDEAWPCQTRTALGAS